MFYAHGLNYSPKWVTCRRRSANGCPNWEASYWALMPSSRSETTSIALSVYVFFLFSIPWLFYIFFSTATDFFLIINNSSLSWWGENFQTVYHRFSFPYFIPFYKHYSYAWHIKTFANSNFRLQTFLIRILLSNLAITPTLDIEETVELPILPGASVQ